MYEQQNIWGPPSTGGSDMDESRSSFEISDGEITPKSNSPRPEDQDDDFGFDNIFNTPKPQPGTIGLRVLRQPEQQHRARYLSEGSRGAVKDRSGKSYCTVQLHGYNRPTRLEIYAGTGSGSVIDPSPLYRVIRVSGKGGSSLTTPCREIVAADGLACLEVTLRPEYNMTAVLDCVGILKICSHSVKRRVPKGIKSSSVRLVFRTVAPDPVNPGQNVLLQTHSQQIVCVQQLGYPEVLRTSVQSAPARGGVDLFVIGRNFDRNTSVIFREYKDDGKLAWSAEATMEPKLLHQCHLVCSIPTYRDLSPSAPVEVSFTVKCGSKSSHPVPFFYQAEAKYQPPVSYGVSTANYVAQYEWVPPGTPTSPMTPQPYYPAVPQQMSHVETPVSQQVSYVTPISSQSQVYQDDLTAIVDLLKSDPPFAGQEQQTAISSHVASPITTSAYLSTSSSESDWKSEALPMTPSQLQLQ